MEDDDNANHALFPLPSLPLDSQVEDSSPSQAQPVVPDNNNDENEFSRSSAPFEQEHSRMSYLSNESDRRDRARFAEDDNASHYSSLSDSPSHAGAEQLDSNLFIWGTEINFNVCKQTFRRFLLHFRLFESDADAYYMAALEQLRFSNDSTLSINCQHLTYFHNTVGSKENLPNLCKLSIDHPRVMIPLMDLIVHEEFSSLVSSQEDAFLDVSRIQIRLFNLPHTIKMRDLDPSHIDQLVQISGMVIRNSVISPDMKQGHFRCTVCHFSKHAQVFRGKIDEPTVCPNCKTKMSFRLIHNACYFADKQAVKVQENTETVLEGETPHTCTVYMYDSLVDCVKPGDRIQLCGILCAKDVRVDPKRRTIKSVYATHIDVLHVSWIAQGTLRAAQLSPEEATMDVEEQKRQFVEMSQSPNLYEDLAESLAPSIFQMLDVKKGLLLQMLGGSNQSTSLMSSGGVPQQEDLMVSVKKNTTSRTRGEINILLCGDPGTSKSQLLGYVHRVAPRGIYTSGKGSSAVGLTAYITKDPETKEMVLESGALVLSDRGVCCIDEFDKMSEATRAILLEVMEQQTISLAKSGIICSLNARTSILASANPVGSRYDPKTSVVDNLKLPPTLLSRFDLIYLILDKADESQDRQLARHLLRLFLNKPELETSHEQGATTAPKYSLEQLSRYITYCRETCRPEIPPNVQLHLIDAYVAMRKTGNLTGGKKTIVATPRQLESFIRLSEASAKLRLAKFVDASDVEEAVRLFNVATQKTAMDPRTGTIDMDCLVTGVSNLDRLRDQSLLEFLRQHLGETLVAGQVINERTLLDGLNARPGVEEMIERPQLQRALEELAREQVLVLLRANGGIRML